MKILRLFDPGNIAEKERSEYRYGKVKKHGIVLSPDTPWERSLNAQGSIVFDPDLKEYRFYYNQQARDFDSPFKECIMMAISKDGFTWEKPLSDHVLFEGEKTNIVDIDMHRQGFPVLIPSVIRNSSNDWEMFYWYYDLKTPRVYYIKAVSEDGWSWITPKPDKAVSILSDQDFKKRKFDPFSAKAEQSSPEKCIIPLNTARFKSNDASYMYKHPENGYEFYGVWRFSNCHNPGLTGSMIRMIQKRTSPDGNIWSTPEMVVWPDKTDPSTHQFYYFSVTPFEQYSLALIGIYHCDFENDVRTLEPQLAFSTDRTNWHRPCRKPFIPRGNEGEFDSQLIICPDQMIDSGDQWLIPYGGYDTPHSKDPLNPDAVTRGKIGLATIPKDHLLGIFSSKNGIFRTKPFFLDSQNLTINTIIYNEGHIKTAITDPLGNVIKGFDFENSVPIIKNGQAISLEWKNRSLKLFLGEMICVKFNLDNAQIFNIKMGER